jgi:hypothetical protein|nr:MAG TPA: protein of unknown function DUF859 [Caudoviricetes sp.]
MASSGSFNTSGYDGRYLKFSWSVQNQSVASNTTKIAWRLEGAGTGGSSWYKAGNFKVVIDGTTVYSSSDRINLYNGTLVARGTYTMTHNSSGTKSFTASAQAGIYTVAVNCTGSGTFTLPTIARVATINSISGSRITDTFSVNYTNYSSSFTNNLLIAINGQSTTQTITDYQSGASFTLSNALKNAIYSASTSSKTVSLSFRLSTYNGNTLIGTSSATLVTVTITNSNPTIGSVAYRDTNSTTVAITGNDQYIIRNKSTLQATLTNLSAQNSATLTKVELTIAGNTTSITLTGTDVATQTVNLGSINLSSNSTLTVKLTDSRGNTATTTATILIYDYVTPTAVISCARESNYYTDTNLLVNANFSSLGGNNAVTIKAYTKLSSASSYGSAIDITNGQTTVLSLDNTEAWNVKIIVSDKLDSTPYVLYVDRGQPIIFFDRLKNSVGINCFPDDSESLEVNGFNILDQLFYKAGDTYTVSGRIVDNGYISNSTKQINFTITLPKSMANVTAQLTDLRLNARHSNGGYVFGSGYVTNGYNVLTDSSLTVTILTQADDFLTIQIESATAFSGVTNNTPVSISMENLTISFS